MTKEFEMLPLTMAMEATARSSKLLEGAEDDDEKAFEEELPPPSQPARDATKKALKAKTENLPTLLFFIICLPLIKDNSE
jgi:hypothetical protein